MSDPRLSYLFHRYIDKTATKEEHAELMALLLQGENEEKLRDLLEEAWQKLEPGEKIFSDEQSEVMLNNLLQYPSYRDLQPDQGKGTPIRSLSATRRMVAAAIIFVLLSTTIYFYYHKSGQQNRTPQTAQRTQPAPINVPAPNGNHAVLMLADGSTVGLDSIPNGTIARQGGANIAKVSDARLVYNIPEEAPPAEKVLYNTVTTRRGGQLQIVLPDGSKVWMNTLSSLRFPTAFRGGERVVELTGEAYFEIEKNQSKPFHVRVGQMDVGVLGTHFNIMAYTEEGEIRTTLLEGGVRVTEGDYKATLLPGQQLKLYPNGNFQLDKNADLELAMAWKNGFTSFKSADIQSIMRQVERWYDIEVEYAGKIPERTFSGGISRSANLSELVRLLQVSKINFTMDGKKLIVMP